MSIWRVLIAALLLPWPAGAQVMPQIELPQAKIIRITPDAEPDALPPLEAPAPPPPEAAPVLPPDEVAPAPALAPATTVAAPQSPFNYVVLRALNKVTAHSETLEAPVGVPMRFGNLEILALACWASEPQQRPENAGLLTIREMKPGEMTERVFGGWMFSSSPSVSSMEHPVYDISMLKCRHEDPKTPADTAKKPAN